MILKVKSKPKNKIYESVDSANEEKRLAESKRGNVAA